MNSIPCDPVMAAGSLFNSAAIQCFPLFMMVSIVRNGTVYACFDLGRAMNSVGLGMEHRHIVCLWSS